MKALGFAVFCCLILHGNAQKITSIANDDWNVSSTWSSGQIPTSSDTILIRHYVTFNQNLVLQPPVTLIIDTNGTLCGSFDLNNTCGTRIFNYGEIYVKSATIRDMKNYKKFWSKNWVTISGCSLPGYGTGYNNIPPNGSTWVWPEVPCKTKFTNWFEEIGVHEILPDIGLSVFPNPFTSEIHIDEEIEFDKLILSDVTGKTLSESRDRVIHLPDLQPGFYFLILFKGSGKATAKLVKLQN